MAATTTTTTNTTPNWDEIVITWKTEQNTCIRCGITFTQANNIGRWQCFEHPNIHQIVLHPGDKWPCCGKQFSETKRITSCGCIPCDHTSEDVEMYPSDTLQIPYRVAQQLGIPEKSTTRNKSANGYLTSSIVKRCNEEVYIKQKSKSDNYLSNLNDV